MWLCWGQGSWIAAQARNDRKSQKRQKTCHPGLDPGSMPAALKHLRVQTTPKRVAFSIITLFTCPAFVPARKPLGSTQRPPRLAAWPLSGSHPRRNRCPAAGYCFAYRRGGEHQLSRWTSARKPRACLQSPALALQTTAGSLAARCRRLHCCQTPWPHAQCKTAGVSAH